MASEKTVSILGCGWFGLPLAHRLVRHGFKVLGSTTDSGKTTSISDAGVRPFVISIEPDKEPGSEEFFGSDIVVVNFPPKRRDDIGEYLAGQTRTLIRALRRGGCGFAILISSTSVYAETGGVLTESDSDTGTPSKPSGDALRRMEKDMAAESFDLTVLRFAGLVGYDRDPRVFLKKRHAAPRSDTPVNLIHRDDCVEITALVIERNIRGKTFNAVSDFHPLRSEFYKTEAQKAGVAAPVFEKTGVGKTVSGEKLKKALGYEFKKLQPGDDSFFS